jgi:hypothetical protein
VFLIFPHGVLIYPRGFSITNRNFKLGWPTNKLTSLLGKIDCIEHGHVIKTEVVILSHAGIF